MKKPTSEIGQSILLIAMAFAGIVGFVGFAVDTGIIYLNRIWLGQAVDAASLAAGYDLPNIKGACARAVEYLQANDYISGGSFSYEIVFPSVPDAPGGDPGAYVISSVGQNITEPGDCANVSVPAAHKAIHYQVQVVAKQQVALVFMNVLGFGEVEAGLDGLAERTRRFDISLVLDNSLSMVYDTCGYDRDLPAPDQEGYSVYAANNLYPISTTILGDNFESYISTADLGTVWFTAGDTELQPFGGHDGDQWVRMKVSSSEQGRLVNTFSVLGERDISLFFWAKDLSMESKDYLDVQWRIWDGTGTAPGWVPLSRIDGSYLTSAWREFGIVMPNGAADSESLQIRFKTRSAEWGEGVGIDDVEIKTSPPVRDQLEPVREYKSGGSNGCLTYSLASPMNVHLLAPQTMLPQVPLDVYSEPLTEFLEQPMYDVLRSTETFVDLIDARRFDTNPPRAREDQFSLTTFSNTGNLLYDLTTNYEEIKRTLFTGIRGDYQTNLGDGMRIGLETLQGGRSTTLHFMVLLTDGRPNRYGASGTKCPTPPFPNPCQATLDYIDDQIAYANSQNVFIYTIGLGNAMTDVQFPAYGDPNYTGQKLLQRIAQSTGGEAYYAPTTAELQKIFEWIADAIFVRLRE